MRKIFLYAHGGSGNHGCEAIVRSTVKILKRQKCVLISSRPEEDMEYGLDKICDIVKDMNNNLKRTNLAFFRSYLMLKLKKDFIPMEKLKYKDSFSKIKNGDIALSIGGDNYCYADVYKYPMLHDIAKERGAKTVLWGCSVEPEVATTPQIASDLARYDLITARETITYEVLKKINPNTILVADPAFQLEVKQVELPEKFIAGNMVGINLSPMVIENEVVSGLTWENYINLIEFIMEKTDMNIALIPHVVWLEGDDRVPLKKLYEKYRNTGRVVMVENHNCMEQKYIISKCSIFVGARTHATIAAYSTGVPTLVVGYSVKARGIARDLFGTEEGYVLPVQALKNSDDLKKAFCWILDNKDAISTRLQSVIPEYCNRAMFAGDKVLEL